MWFCFKFGDADRVNCRRFPGAFADTIWGASCTSYAHVLDRTCRANELRDVVTLDLDIYSLDAPISVCHLSERVRKTASLFCLPLPSSGLCLCAYLGHIITGRQSYQFHSRFQYQDRTRTRMLAETAIERPGRMQVSSIVGHSEVGIASAEPASSPPFVERIAAAPRI